MVAEPSRRRRPSAGCQLGEELADVGRPRLQRVEAVRGEVLAVLEEVGAVGVQGVAREAALQLQVGEEVEDEPSKRASAPGSAWARTEIEGFDRNSHARLVLAAHPQPLRRKGLCAVTAERVGPTCGPGPKRPRLPSLNASRGCTEDPTRGKGGCEEERVLGQASSHRLGRQTASGVALEVNSPHLQSVSPRQPADSNLAAISSSPSGTRDAQRGRAAAPARSRVVAHAAVARARIDRREAGEIVVCIPRASAAWAVSRAAIPPWPSSRRRADDPRARPGQHCVPAEAGRRRRGRRPTLIASRSPPYAGAAVTWPQSSPRSRSCATSRESEPGSAPPPVCT